MLLLPLLLPLIFSLRGKKAKRKLARRCCLSPTHPTGLRSFGKKKKKKAHETTQHRYKKWLKKQQQWNPELVAVVRTELANRFTSGSSALKGVLEPEVFNPWAPVDFFSFNSARPLETVKLIHAQRRNTFKQLYKCENSSWGQKKKTSSMFSDQRRVLTRLFDIELKARHWFTANEFH